MKSIVFICLLFLVTSNSYSQGDSLAQCKVRAIVSEFSKNILVVPSYGNVPKFIRSYLNNKNKYKCRILNSRFNGKDIGAGRRRNLSYVAKSKNDYIISYEHGGQGYHCHSIILETNGKQIINGYNVVFFKKQNNVTEFMNMLQQPQSYKVIKYDELSVNK